MKEFSIYKDDDCIAISTDLKLVSVHIGSGWDGINIDITKEEALQLAAALVSAAKEIE